jgi:uncharacterized membrane protein (DUF106 family)
MSDIWSSLENLAVGYYINARTIGMLIEVIRKMVANEELMKEVKRLMEENSRIVKTYREEQ